MQANKLSFMHEALSNDTMQTPAQSGYRISHTLLATILDWLAIDHGRHRRHCFLSAATIRLGSGRLVCCQSLSNRENVIDNDGIDSFLRLNSHILGVVV